MRGGARRGRPAIAVDRPGKAGPDVERVRRPRDSQRQRCYDAEATVSGVHDGRALPTVRSIENWLTVALAGHPDPPAVTVGPGSGSRRARATWSPERGHRLQVPRHDRTELVLCHELAHVLVVHEHGLQGAAPHGWQWAASYLELVERWIGARARSALATAFAAHRVRVGPPRPR